MPAALTSATLARLMGRWHHGAGPAYRELSDVVRLLILDGRLPLDTSLPSERSLSETLGLSRTTVTAAYAQLRESGFLSSGQGAKGRTRLPRTAKSAAPGLAAPDGLLDLAYASLPASGEVVHRAYSAAIVDLPAQLPGFGYEVLGLPALRAAVAAHYSQAGLPTTAEQILITSGAQHALTIILRADAQPQHGRPAKVLVEHPSYPNALDAIAAAGARVTPVSVGLPGHSNWDMAAFEQAFHQQRPALAYLVPDFHNPTGRLMPDSQRRQLVRTAQAADTVLVIDETLRDLNLDGLQTQHVAAFGPSVVTIGSLSKSHWAGLRTGWIRASSTQIRRYAAARTTLDLGGPIAEQLAATHLLADFDEPLPARLAALRSQRAALQDLLARHLPTWEVPKSDGGLSLWCRLPAPISTALTVLAPEFGVRLAAGPRFGVGGSFERHLRIPYTLPAGDLETAVIALRNAQAKLEAAPQLRRTLSDPPRAAIA